MPASYSSTYNFVPATASTTNVAYASASTTVCNQPIFGWSWAEDWFSALIEEDAIIQRRDRKLRYAPFHISKKKIVKSIYSNTKPVPHRQTILQPFRITRA